ncbi:MAG: glycoside hydrolase family 3 protein [Lachnospiraceae bacterium]|nr:glycoside hydrolase family 3 protein [Candidatus Merdinaster equi]
MTLDWNEYVENARQISSEGCVLLENKNQVLPLKSGVKLAVFGRTQNNYYKSGLGSGGMVNVSRVIGILEALKDSGKANLNESLLAEYANFEEKNPYDEGEGWGQEPWCQKEMEISDELAQKAAEESDVALVLIGRTAGEDKDAKNAPGSYRLTELEEKMLGTVRNHFKSMVVVLNSVGLIDLSFIDGISPDAVLLGWSGGMIGGLGVVDILFGDECPSGHLTDTVSYEIEDHYADKNFGDYNRDFYEEDIYVGYRYFETFAKNLVRYPFGYGLSYTSFKLASKDLAFTKCDDWKVSGAGSTNRSNLAVTITVNTTNSGSVSGKEVLQLYVEAPQGQLGKPSRVLADFHKTKLLAPGESEEYIFNVPARVFASYDDEGVSKEGSAFILEAGEYKFYLGENVRDAEYVGSLSLENMEIIDQLYEALRPVEAFDRIKPLEEADGTLTVKRCPVTLCTKDMDERRAEELPAEITSSMNVALPISADDYDRFGDDEYIDSIVSQLTDYELTCLVRGEGMGSSRVTPGTAAAFAGVSDSLTERVGIPAVCCSDGPSGMRLDCGMKAFSLPSAIMMACTFNAELIRNLYACTGKEMITNKVDCLLGPGMNIHRHPLNGRNFEYFSEDPYLTGVMARAMVQGLEDSGVSGVCKHFCGNNQEYRRHFLDSVISERALREIYLKGFEWVVRNGEADSIMTTYGAVNGLFTAGNYDLNTSILRKQWGFTGIVMTDWWASINERGQKQDKVNFGAMVRSQNDMYMVCPDGGSNASGDNIEEAYASGLVTKGELQRTAKNVIRFALGTQAMKRLMGMQEKVTIINRPSEDMDVNLDDVEFIKMDGDITIPLDTKDSKAGTNYILPFDMSKLGTYEITIVASSPLGELAQIPVTLFYTSFPLRSFTFHGTNGEEMEIARTAVLKQRFAVMRLYVAKNGLKLKEIRFKFLNEEGTMSFLEDGLKDNSEGK